MGRRKGGGARRWRNDEDDRVHQQWAETSSQGDGSSVSVCRGRSGRPLVRRRGHICSCDCEIRNPNLLLSARTFDSSQAPSFSLCNWVSQASGEGRRGCGPQLVISCIAAYARRSPGISQINFYFILFCVGLGKGQFIQKETLPYSSPSIHFLPLPARPPDCPVVAVVDALNKRC